jgi:membrane protein YqaA with SNARE-associated domain
MGYGAERAYERVRHRKPTELRALQWLERFGAKACLLSWLPAVGDPLCAVAGWLRLPFWPCVAYMAIGKFARYVTMTALLLWVFPGTFSLP